MTIDFNHSLHPVLTSLEAISKRQKLVSNNIANAHTPGYTAKAVSFSDLLHNMQNPFETDLSRKLGTTLPDAVSTGAPVSLQTELIEMQKNTLFYGMVTRRASTLFNNMRAATQIGR